MGSLLTGPGFKADSSHCTASDDAEPKPKLFLFLRKLRILCSGVIRISILACDIDLPSLYLV
jgi:hypothetical protein